MTIRDHWRWNITRTLRHDPARGDDFCGSVLQLSAHAFTHVDTPLHCNPNGPSLEKLDVYAYSGSAAIVDISSIRANEAITAGHFADNCSHVKTNDIVILKTLWSERCKPDSKEYWTQAPYMTDEACQLLASLKPRVIGFDFPQDHILKTIDGSKRLTLAESTAHKHLLYNGVLFIEYLCNLGAVKQNRVNLIALPLKLEGVEGSPVRVVAIED